MLTSRCLWASFVLNSESYDYIIVVLFSQQNGSKSILIFNQNYINALLATFEVWLTFFNIYELISYVLFILFLLILH